MTVSERHRKTARRIASDKFILTAAYDVDRDQLAEEIAAALAAAEREGMRRAAEIARGSSGGFDFQSALAEGRDFDYGFHNGKNHAADSIIAAILSQANTHSQAPEHKAAGHAPRNEGSDGANAGGKDVDRSTERAGHAGQPFDALTGQFESRNSFEIVERNTSGPDAKRAPNSHSVALPPGATEQAGTVSSSPVSATHHASRNGEG